MTTEAIHGDDLDLHAEKITHTIVMVSAETAKRWLAHNKRNRNISPTDVQRYRLDMEAGLWRFAADPIRFDVNGNLIDGQHRLTALSELADICLPMLIVRGLPPETQKVMDQGRKRTPGQQLYLSGIKDANLGIDPEYQPAARGYYLYRVEIVKYPEGAWTFQEVDGEEYSWINEDWQPEGWAPDEGWAAQYGERFFWPSTKYEYRSQSSAKSRARLIESFGATAVVVRSSLITWDEPNAGVESKPRSK